MKYTTAIIKQLTCSILILVATAQYLHAQDDNNELEASLDDLSAELDALFADSDDSLSLLFLIDSILTLDDKNTQLSVRLGYSSRVTSAGRDFGVDQQGLSPGISLYHHSGLYADITGFWNSEFDPQYNLTVTTLGYLGSIGKKWSYSFSYDHSFFRTNDELQEFPVNNSLGTSVTYDFKYVYTGVDYSFAFGDDTAHRLAWNITGYIKRKPFKPFKSITFLPTFTVLFGNQSITQSYFNVDRFEQIKNLTRQDIVNLARSGNYTAEEIQTIIFVRQLTNRDDLTDRQQEVLNEFFTTAEEIDTFGLMNYYLSFPLSLTTNKLNVLLSYNYNIPVELSGSEYESDPNGYFSFTIGYNISLK